MTTVLINPNLVVQPNDPFTTGIVYMPISLAYVAASLREAGENVLVIDAYGQDPWNVRRQGGFLFYGLSEEAIISQIPASTKVIFVYAINLTSHNAAISIIASLRKAFPHLKIIVLENTQAVTAYSLKEVAKEFKQVGADFVLTGEAEISAVEIVRSINKGRASFEQGIFLQENVANGPDPELDSLPFPAWDLFPLENYWQLKFAHGPLSQKRYLPLLTSRGCPYACRFCVVPATNKQRWRGRSANSVVDEMEFLIARFGTNEFHLEDLDPTISDQRIREICRAILDRGINVIWKIAAGTKVETLRNEETLDLMAQAGCRYISISPETGSPGLLKQINKPFDLDHAIRMVNHMNKVNIRSQACFVLGFPGETKDDLKMTKDLVKKLTQEGIDEIALFIVTPVPGSAIYKEFAGFRSLSELNFTPKWRSDYRSLNRFRLNLYLRFLFWKIIYHPGKILRQARNFFSRSFETKMEMVPYRALRLKISGLKA